MWRIASEAYAYLAAPICLYGPSLVPLSVIPRTAPGLRFGDLLSLLTQSGLSGLDYIARCMVSAITREVILCTLHNYIYQNVGVTLFVNYEYDKMIYKSKS